MELRRGAVPAHPGACRACRGERCADCLTRRWIRTTSSTWSVSWTGSSTRWGVFWTRSDGHTYVVTYLKCICYAVPSGPVYTLHDYMTSAQRLACATSPRRDSCTVHRLEAERPSLQGTADIWEHTGQQGGCCGAAWEPVSMSACCTRSTSRALRGPRGNHRQRLLHPLHGPGVYMHIH